jgi:hypothetical protein
MALHKVYAAIKLKKKKKYFELFGRKKNFEEVLRDSEGCAIAT